MFCRFQPNLSFQAQSRERLKRYNRINVCTAVHRNFKKESGVEGSLNRVFDSEGEKILSSFQGNLRATAALETGCFAQIVEKEEEGNNLRSMCN